MDLVLDDFIPEEEPMWTQMEGLVAQEEKSAFFEPDVARLFDNLNAVPPQTDEDGIAVPAAGEGWLEPRVSSTTPVSSGSPVEDGGDEKEVGDHVPHSWSSNASATESDQKLPDAKAEYAGLSAVEVARRKAQDMAMASIGGKRRSTSGDERQPKREKVDPNESPEKVHQRRYQRRLQKNRDTAFISRIRRRAYTTLLEEALTNVEDEKKKLSGSVESLKAEIANLKTELRGLYANKLQVGSADGKSTSDVKALASSDMSDHSVENGQSPVQDLLQSMFKPFPAGEKPSEEQSFHGEQRSGSYQKKRKARGRGGHLLMLSLLFVITIPGLYFSPTVTEVMTLSAKPVESVDLVNPARVWMEDGAFGIDGATTLDARDRVVDPGLDACRVLEYETISCIGKELNLENNIDTGVYVGRDLIAQ
uniref:BZIP domain-containing protein n=1 Tax=Rhodosorus marinus TaxID=101924 RepID=A0A7S3A6F9_9RHOD|mmetsp:Transcript_5039/g.21801  ORF Transcript_5039/g.21801 Transcript_5039/m.21801 type:complete len:421 (+) Transcript_5039:87-1349(+)